MIAFSAHDTPLRPVTVYDLSYFTVSCKYFEAGDLVLHCRYLTNKAVTLLWDCTSQSYLLCIKLFEYILYERNLLSMRATGDQCPQSAIVDVTIIIFVDLQNE